MSGAIRFAHRTLRVVLAFAFAGGALAQSSGGAFEIRRHVFAGGGGHADGGIYALDGAIAQPEADAVASGGAFELRPAFWHGVAAQAPLPDPLFGDGFEM